MKNPRECDPIGTQNVHDNLSLFVNRLLTIQFSVERRG